MDGRNPDMFELDKICPLCNLPILDNQSRVMQAHYGTGELRTVHRKCRDKEGASCFVTHASGDKGSGYGGSGGTS